MAEDAEQQQLLEKFAGNHPAFKPGKLQSRDGEPYNPADVKYDTSGNEYMKSFPDPNVQETEKEVDGGQPAATQQQAQATQEPAEEPKEQPLIFGKYRTMDEANKGFEEAQKLLRERSAENIALKAAREVLEASGFRRQREQPTPPGPENIPVQFDKEGQPYVPSAVVQKMAEQYASEVARSRVDEVLTPMANFNTATTNIQAKYPEFAQHQSEFARFLQDTPEVSERVMKDPDFALQAAYLMFREQNGNEVRQQTQQTTQRSQAVIDDTKRAASTTSRTAQATRQVAEGEVRDKKLGELYEYGRQTGDFRPYQKFRLEEALNLDGTLDAIKKSGWGR